MNTKIRILLVILLCFVLSGCSLNLGNIGSKKIEDSGFFISYDRGETWVQKVEYLRVGPNRLFFKTAQSTFIKQDPNDPKAIYLGTLQDGLLYSFDGGLGWQKTLFQKGVVYDIEIDSKYRCTMYGAVSNKIYKTEDCGRNWRQIYIDGNNKNIKSILIDYVSNNKVYFATADGRFYKSDDFGVSWKMLKSFDKQIIVKTAMNSNNPNKIYVCTEKNGIFKTENGGIDWVNITDRIDLGDKKTVSSINNYRDFEFDLSKDDAFFYANKYGIFYSKDGGATWNVLKLLTKPSSVNIYSIASNPKNSNEIYYTIPNKFYKTLDGGNTWVTKTLPTKQVPIDMMVDRANQNSIFMAVKLINK
ncbi:MAG: hypothetical protein PHH83_02025 [Patescibacteria group bacterium]|nr:hypothetical protein [Patescibacteria group bacterium]